MVLDESGFGMKVVLDEKIWDEKRHFHPNLDESVPNQEFQRHCEEVHTDQEERKEVQESRIDYFKIYRGRTQRRNHSRLGAASQGQTERQQG